MADGKRKNIPEGKPLWCEIENKSLFHRDETKTLMPSEWNIRMMHMCTLNQARELHRMLFGDMDKAKRYLEQGLRLLKMWQREKQPLRKAYYWRIHELKLARALGKQKELKFYLYGECVILKKDEHGKARLYRMEEKQ